MRIYVNVIGFSAVMLWFALAAGCQGQGRKTPNTAAQTGEMGVTIGELAEVFASDTIPVRGYALVGGLNGTGSSECPAAVRAYLEKYIRTQLSGTNISAEQLIASPDTAVVELEGIIPAAASREQRFDLKVSALAGTSTTSIEGGWLYGADLYEARRFGAAFKPLAAAEGAVFIDGVDAPIADRRTGFLLAGGVILDDFKMNLAIRRPDFKTASDIRNRINELFGAETAWAVSPAQIELRVPPRYARRKDRFIEVLKATYLADTPELADKRILTLVQQLAVSQNKPAVEIALEAVGNRSADKLSSLLNSSSEEVRLRAARCMLNLGDQRGLDTLWNIAADKHSAYRTDAIRAIIVAGKVDAATAMLRGLLGDDDFQVRLTAYENLLPMKDVSIASVKVQDSFYLDQIPQPGKPVIYVSRSGQPRVAIFGSPIYCVDNIFVELPDGSVTINAPAGQGYASIVRRHPTRPDVIVQLKSSFELGDIIKVLCEPPKSQAGGRVGLGLPYSTLVVLLKRMVDEGAVNADFHAGPLPQTGPNVKKQPPVGR